MQSQNQKDFLKPLQRDVSDLVRNSVTGRLVEIKHFVKKSFKLLNQINLEKCSGHFQKYIISSKAVFLFVPKLYSLFTFYCFTSFHCVKYLCIFKMKLLLNIMLGDLNQPFYFYFKMS